MIDNVSYVDNLDFVMESDALGHTMMDQRQDHESLLEIAVTLTFEENDGRKWIICDVIHQGLEIKDSFYGTSGSLYAISPVVHVFSPQEMRKILGIATCIQLFSLLLEDLLATREFLEEDSSRVIVRHHAADKTFEHGSFFPGQDSRKFRQ